MFWNKKTNKKNKGGKQQLILEIWDVKGEPIVRVRLRGAKPYRKLYLRFLHWYVGRPQSEIYTFWHDYGLFVVNRWEIAHWELKLIEE